MLRNSNIKYSEFKNCSLLSSDWIFIHVDDIFPVYKILCYFTDTVHMEQELLTLPEHLS